MSGARRPSLEVSRRWTTAPAAWRTARCGRNATGRDLRTGEKFGDRIVEFLACRSETVDDRFGRFHDGAHLFLRLTCFTRCACRFHDRAKAVELWLVGVVERLDERVDLSLLS